MKDLKIGTQLRIGLALMLIFVLALGYISYDQSEQLQQQTELLFNHPVKVRSAIGELEADILNMRLGTRDLMLATDEEEKKAPAQNIALAAADALGQFEILRQKYLGPEQDVEEAYRAFFIWETERQKNFSRIDSGEIEKIKDSVLSSGEIGKYREELLIKIRKIDNFAQAKTDLFYNQSIALKARLNQNLFILVSLIFVLTFLINFVLYRNINRPLHELLQTKQRFHEGDLSARSSVESNNEFGLLANSFNVLARDIQAKIELNQKATLLAGTMMNENDPAKFFQATLQALSALTGSQMAAIYLLSDDRKHFRCSESIGTGSLARKKFRADKLEGQFGAVISEKKIVYLTRIPDETPFSFPVATGEFRPREIVSIPILEFGEVVAVVTLGSLHEFSASSIQLLHETWNMVIARVVGVLSFKKITNFSAKLERQNYELEQQAREMVLQADELKEFNIELELQKKQLNEANQLKSAFLSNMSHELRTPLNSVIALSGVLTRRLQNQIQEEEYSYLGIIEKNGKQLLALINDILDLSRIEAGKEEINDSQFIVQELVKNIFETLQPIATGKGVELVNLIPENLHPIIGDSAKCHHILQNMIGNAVKFTEKGSVEVSAELKDGKLYLGVKDTGIGIPEDLLPFIFDEFRQADGRTSRKYGGTGLGLAIAKKYTRMLGGTIEVRSQEGAGSTFVVMLPESPSILHSVSSSIHQTENKAPLYVTTETGHGKTLLLVEDSEPQIIQLSDILKEEGYSILVARNGKQALDAIQISFPDAMILDLMMPEVDGFEVLETIRKQKATSRLPVLILSAKHVTKDELSFLKGNNIHQLIQKGDVNRSELLGCIRNMLNLNENLKVPEKERKSVVKSDGGKQTILLIDDNPDNTVTVKALLDDKYEIVTATDGLTGLEKAIQLDPDLILMDISLSGMDGYTVLKEIKMVEKLNPVPVIALTARAMKGDREELLAQGFDDYISKPIDHVLFGETIHRWLNGDKEK